MVNSHPIAPFLMVNSHPIALSYVELLSHRSFSLARVKRVCVSQTELRSTDCKNQVVTHCSTPPAALRWPLTESSLTCWNSSQHLSHVILTKVSSEVRIADAERVKNFRRAVTTSVQEAKPLGDDITKEQWGTLKNPKQD